MYTLHAFKQVSGFLLAFKINIARRKWIFSPSILVCFLDGSGRSLLISYSYKSISAFYTADLSNLSSSNGYNGNYIFSNYSRAFDKLHELKTDGISNSAGRLRKWSICLARSNSSSKYDYRIEFWIFSPNV